MTARTLADLPDPTGVIFDFDGTLACTEEAVAQCARQTAIDLLGTANFADKDIQGRMGLPLAQVFFELGAKDLAQGEAMALHYRAIFHRFSGPIRLYPQAKAYLQALADRGIKIAIASSRGVESLHELVERLGLAPLVQAIVGEEDPERKKPHPDPALLAAQRAGFSATGAWMIGDTTFDMDMGHKAHCHCIGLTHGSHDHQRLSQSCPFAILFDSFEPLMQHLPGKAPAASA